MTTEESGVPARGRDNLGTVLTVLALLHAALVLIQGVLAGDFLDGNSSAIRIHQAIGTSVLYPVAVGQAILAGMLWRRKQLVLSYPLLCVATVVVEGAQIGLGFTGNLTWHVPLGVALSGATVALLFMQHGPSATPAGTETSG